MLRFASLFACCLVLGACAGHPIASNNPTLVYGGVFAGEDGTEAGSFSLTISLNDNTGSGTFIVNGDSRSYTGTYDGASVTTAGSGFTFIGDVEDSIITGSYTSPNGGGLFTGLRKTSSVSPVTYCGAHIGAHIGDPIAGAFTFVQGGGTRRGVFTSVLNDPFRGELRSTSTAGPVTLVNLPGDASLSVASNSFSGSYATVAGDTGAMQGIRCPGSVVSPIISVFDGVLGSFDGGELGSLTFNLSSTGVGSTGHYTIGAVAKQFLAVISGVNSQVAAFDSDVRIVLSLENSAAGTTASGRYARTGSIAGRVAALNRGAGTTEAYCGQHNLAPGGAFSFVVRSDNVLFGLYTGGTAGSGFQGEITGAPGTDVSALETETGPVTILPSPGTFGGFWDHSATGGTAASLSGVGCNP
jgi:hypothetical protein